MAIKRIILTTITSILALALAVIGLGLTPETTTAQANTSWTVEYFNNVNLVGPAVYTTTVNTVGFNWTANAPVPNVNADFFSARWTSTQTLEPGTYQINTRADDGVRVWVDNRLLINEFHTSSGLTYTAEFTVAGGPHAFVVDYYEGGGNAFLSYNMQPVDVTSPTGASARVEAFRLNVRDQPGLLTGTVITQLTRNEVVPVVGRNLDSSWWQVQANGFTGWVSGSWVQVQNVTNVPVTDGEPATDTGFNLTADVNLNIRSGPGIGNPIIGWLPVARTARIIGRNSNTSWWQIEYNNVTGWVSGVYTTLQSGTDINAIPMTETGTPDTPTYTLTARVNLNIRSGPGVTNPIVGWLPVGSTAELLGRNAAGTWVKITYANVTGWVSRFYTNLPGGITVNDLPVTA